VNRPGNILVLDDERDAVATFESILRTSGYEVMGFTNSHEAYDYLKHHPFQFDLVISDIKMPIMDGIKFAKQANELLPGLRLILVTAFEFHNPENIEMASIGVREIARKPLSVPQLLAIVAKHIGKNERLDTLYFCQECPSMFLFQEDVREHESRNDHHKFLDKALV
jgi:DNA-binding NtrC family response regulator